MLLPVNTIRSPHHVELTSKLTSLSRVAKDLAPTDPETATISGEITLRLDNAGFVHAQGDVTAKALRPCDLCGEDVLLNLSAAVKASFRPPYESKAPRDMSLAAEDLDVYFIDNGCIDLEVLINDTLQCAIPYHVTCESSGHHPCCKPPENEHASSSRTGENSPFAVLKALK